MKKCLDRKINAIDKLPNPDIRQISEVLLTFSQHIAKHYSTMYYVVALFLYENIKQPLPPRKANWNFRETIWLGHQDHFWQIADSFFHGIETLFFKTVSIVIEMS